MDGVELRWRPVSAYDDLAGPPLDEAEQTRADAFVDPTARARFVLGCVMLKDLLAELAGADATGVGLRRRCPTCGGPHGRVWAPAGVPLHLSVSHAGGWVLAAAGRVPLGVDLEPVAPVDAGVLDLALGPRERERLGGAPQQLRDLWFARYWTRKEAVLKATGDGLRVEPGDLWVSSPDEPAALLAWRGRPEAGRDLVLTDLDAPPGHVAALARLRSTS